MKSKKLHRAASSSIKPRTGRGRKVTSLRIPPVKLAKAQAMLAVGHSQREVGRSLQMSTHTVAKVIRTEDFQGVLREIREKAFAVAPVAIESVEASVATDGRLALAFLKYLGIFPSRETIQSLENSTTPDYYRFLTQAQKVAPVLIESQKSFGIDLPKEFADALVRDDALRALESETGATVPEIVRVAVDEYLKFKKKQSE